MTEKQHRQVTIIYYSDISLELLHETHTFAENAQGRVILPAEFKENKSIIAVCDGEIKILNKLGDRITLLQEANNLESGGSNKEEIQKSVQQTTVKAQRKKINN